MMIPGDLEEDLKERKKTVKQKERIDWKKRKKQTNCKKIIWKYKYWITHEWKWLKFSNGDLNIPIV